MYVQVGGPDWGKIIPLFLGILVGVCILMVLFYLLMKKKDSMKPLITAKVKILEKPIQQGNVEWYVVECENGERLKLRSFRANQVIITIGDEGTIRYRGKTIQSFQRQ